MITIIRNWITANIHFIRKVKICNHSFDLFLLDASSNRIKALETTEMSAADIYGLLHKNTKKRR